jgi:DNA repair protein RadC
MTGYAGYSDMRTIIKFDPDGGRPYMKILDNVPGAGFIAETLLNMAQNGNERPVIVAGDLSGMGEFNNRYGREAADEAIEKALEVFVKEFEPEELAAGSPSGDEMWGVMIGDIETEKIIYRLSEVLKKLNMLGHRAGNDVVGLNAKFYVGRKSFAEVEKHLKYHPETGLELPPGVIAVEGALLNSRRDVIIKPKEVSSEKIVFKIAGSVDKRNSQNQRRNFKEGHSNGIAPKEKAGAYTEKARVLTGREKEIFADALEREASVYPERFRFAFNALKKLIDTFGAGAGGSSARPPERVSDGKTQKFQAAKKGRAPMSNLKLLPEPESLLYARDLKLLKAEDAAGLFYELKNRDREKFVTLMLDGNDEIIAAELVSVGTLNSSLVHPREVFKLPLALGARKLVLAHNHPSGDEKPSGEDISLTKRLREVAKSLDIEIKFHIVIGDDKYTALFADGETEEGELKKTPEVYPVVRYEGAAAPDVPDDKAAHPDAIRTPADAVGFVRPLFKNTGTAALAIFMDSRNMVVSVDFIDPALGEAAKSEIIRLAMLANAAGFIVCSNFGADDKKIKELKKGGDISGIEMMDFIVLNKGGGFKTYVSKKADGVISEGKLNYETARGNRSVGHPQDGGGDGSARGNASGRSASGGEPEKLVPSSAREQNREGTVMIKVSEQAAKGSYAAKIAGLDEKYGVKREFLKSHLEPTKRKGFAELSISPDDIAKGDIVSLKIVRFGGGEARENFYRVVSEPSDNAALHDIVRKIPGGLEEVKKMLAQNPEAAGMDNDGDIFGKEDTPIFSEDPRAVATAIGSGGDGGDSTERYSSDDDLIVTKGSLRKSYAAIITGAEPDGRLKRDFVSFYKEGALRVAASNVKQGDVVSMKIIRAGQEPGEAKEHYYQITKEPDGETQMHKIVRKITRDEVVSLVSLKAAGGNADESQTGVSSKGVNAETFPEDDAPFLSEDSPDDGISFDGGGGSGDEETGDSSRRSGGKPRGRGRAM